MADLDPSTFSSSMLLGLVFGGALVTAVAIWAMGQFGHLVTGRHQSLVSRHIAERLPAPLGILGGIVVGLLLFRWAEPGLPPTVEPIAQRVAVVLAAATGAWAFVRLARLALQGVAGQRRSFEPASRVGSRLVGLVVYIVALLAILSAYDVSITPLLAGLGIGALAVALALQDTMSNFFAGLWIQTERPVAPGNYVRVEGQNVEGFVEVVGWRTTRIRALAGNLIVVPNSKLAQATVTDFSLPDPSMSVVMTFRMPFDVEPQRAMALLVEEAKEAAKLTPALLESPAPFANATPGFGDSSIGYSLIIKVREFVDQWNAQTAVTQRVWARMQREGIRFAYPTRVNLQGNGEDFVPDIAVRPARRPLRQPEGRDPRAIEADQAKQDIAARQAAVGQSPQPPPQPPSTPAPPAPAPAPPAPPAATAPAGSASAAEVSTAPTPEGTLTKATPPKRQ